VVRVRIRGVQGLVLSCAGDTGLACIREKTSG
jgi:Asp/Glu/hydantoin racemase